MGAETSDVAGLPADSGAGVFGAGIRSRDGSIAGDTRLRSELEQLHVTLEDMEQRMQDLIRNNAELREQLIVETRLRREAEHRVQELLATPPASAADPAAEALLREELSLALEELQVMQEELQVAHDALGAERRAIQ